MRRALVYGLAALVGLLVIAAFAFVLLQPIQVLPRIRLAPAWVLRDREGRLVSNEDLRGQIVLYTFTYTRCRPPCPQPDRTMQAIYRRLAAADLGDVPVTLMTISFDVAHDSPAVLKAYAAAWGAEDDRWRFAVGTDPQRLKTVIGEGFQVYYQPREDGRFDFDPVYILVDGWGIIRREYRYRTLTPDVDRIVRHIGVLAEEVQNSRGAARLAYEAAHLFLCYAP
ncbi:MAG: SCO family protein [Caldilineales bacterium]|nr:SCO family protein [Caldilineales bacterium]